MENVIIAQAQTPKAAVYCRVSTDEQVEKGMSLDVQERSCTKQAQEDGYEVVAVFRDEGKSGGTMEREGIRGVIRLASEQKIQAVYAVHTDRIARHVLNYLKLRELFREKGVVLKCLHQPMTDDSATSRTMDTVIASFNEMHRLVTSEKVRDTLYAKAKAGYMPTVPPPGYKNVDNLDPKSEQIAKKIVIVDEETAPLIQEMFRLFSTGQYSGYDLADIMFEKGLRSRGKGKQKDKATKGGKLSRSQLYNVLRNRFYLGEVHWGPIHNTEGKHEALIDPFTFNQVQAMLASHNKHACRRRKYSWLLNGFLYCYKHERRYTAEWHLVKTKRIAYYHCTYPHGCGKYAEMTEMEDKVAEKFKDMEFAPEFVDSVIAKAKEIFYQRRHGYDSKRKRLINQRTAREDRIRTLEERMMERQIDGASFTRLQESEQKEIQRIEEQLAKLDKGHGVQVDIAKEILRFTENVYNAYQEASPNLKRHYLGFFWQKFEVSDGLIIKSHPSLLFDTLLKLQQATLKKPLAKKANSTVKVITSAPLLRAARELRTVIQGGWHSYAMDAAVKVLRNEEPFDEETMRWMEKVHPQTNSR